MKGDSEQIKSEYNPRDALGYSFGQFADVSAFQMFTFLIFTFYFAVKQLNVILISLGFILWSIWSAFNAPLLGIISDRTKTRFGKRKPFIMLAFIPLAILMVLLWTPPNNGELPLFLYFLIIIILFDTVYTIYSVNRVSVFPAMFQNLEDRARANSIRQIFSIIALIFAFIIPSFFIPKYDNPQYASNYIFAALFMACVIIGSSLIFIKYGIKERKEFIQDAKNAPKFFESIKFTLKNKTFLYWIIPDLATWYVFGMLPTIIPLYGSYVLGIGEGESFLLSLLLGISFISAVIFIFFWKWVALKVGLKRGAILSMSIFILVLIPNLFISDLISGFITFFAIGIGFSGSLYFRDPIISTIADDDELKTGVRREGGYYGVSALIIRLSTILIYLSISTVFTSTGWAVFNPVAGANTILGLRLLLSVFPMSALFIGLIMMSRFPITKERYLEIRTAVDKMHEDKKLKLLDNLE